MNVTSVMSSPPPCKKSKVITPEEDTSSKLTNIFQGVCVLIVEQGLGKTRCNILQKQLMKHGGVVAKSISSNITHIVVTNGMKKEKLLKLIKLKDIESNIKVVNADWLSACLVKGELVEENVYLAFPVSGDEITLSSEIDSSDFKEKDMSMDTTNLHIPTESSSKQKVRHGSESSYEDSVENSVVLPTSSEKPPGAFVCSKPSSSAGENHNVFITDKLAILEKTYTSTQDRWRAFGYKKAIGSIKKYHKPLESFEEVVNLPFVGERLAKKIWEIIETGHLRRLDHIDPKVELLNKFAAVWGAGPKTAEQWIAKGYTSLDDLHEKATLTSQQTIGLKYYDDINEKMPRSEVAQIEQLVRDAVESVMSGVEMTVCGSYRRGRAYCGDIDVLLSHPDGRSHQGLLKTLINKLKDNNLITHNLITVENEEQRKYMGLCKLPIPESKYRRIDFIVAPYNEWPLALTHFTGSAHFNRSIRLLAKKKNMSLSEHALRKDVVYDGKGDEKLSKGSIVPVFCEEDIFRHLGLDYLEPTDRDW